MFKTDTKYSEKDSGGFLSEVWFIDRIAAIRIANEWFDKNARTDKSSAALRLLRFQDIAPLCSICERAVFRGEPHGKCEEVRQANKVQAV